MTASVTTATGQSSAASAKPAVGGTASRATDRAHTMASTAPAAPSMWPVVPLMDVTGSSAGASAPMRFASAFDSVASLAGVPVPWAFRCPRSAGVKPPSARAAAMAAVIAVASGSGAVM